MKKIYLLIFANLLMLAPVFSQQITTGSPIQDESHYKRCATDERVKMLFKKFPERKAIAEKLAAEVPGPNAFRKAARLTGVVYLPVVFHIVLPNPYAISDAVIQNQIDALNTDFAGKNADSTNIPAAFQNVRGHSLIQFVLAKRTPTGQLTNGVVRLASDAKGSPYSANDSIKRSVYGGSDAWDPTQYINIWVGEISGQSGVLGYTQIPGSGDIKEDGIFCNRVSFGISSCNVSVFNKGRTVVHEMGHYFGLNHIWGDDENETNKCSGDDFRAMTDDGSSFVLPLTLYNPHGKGNTPDDIGDTPNQSIASSSCLSGTVTDNCSPSAPGIMYQDYMDYTLDNCYSMFTNKQVERMEYVLQNFRAALMTSTGGTVPAGAANRDASPIVSINPGGSEVSGCNSIYYPASITCGGSLAPKVLIINKGLDKINSVTVGYTLNGAAPVTVNINPALVFGNNTLVSFPAITLGPGNYTFKFFTQNVNGAGADQVTSNDTLSASLTIQSPSNLPLSEGFENAAFPPAGWTIINPDNTNSWEKITPGNNSAHSMYINNFDNNSDGQVDEIRTPKLNLPGNNPVVISFDLAHKNYPDPSYYDTLNILVSKDCGATFTSVFKKWGPALATAGSSSDSYLNPAPGDWQTQKINIDPSLLNGGGIIVEFKCTSSWGNNIYIDNVNIKSETSRDLTVTDVNPPALTDCEKPTAPVATVKNTGFSPITGFTISYAVDNGAPSQTTVSNISLAPDAQMNVTLNSFTPAGGQHIITVFSANPIATTGTGDQSPANDTLRKAFFVLGNVNSPVTEGFENAQFPPSGWAVENPDNNITWTRTTAAAETGTGSMVIPNYNYTYPGTTDKFISSVITGNNTYDTMYVSFDYAFAARNGVTPDTLELQATTDCGQTFTSIWKKWGTDLQTTANPVTGAFTPASTDWENVKLNLMNTVGSQDFQLYFVSKGNRQNNLYIDNINIYGIKVPELLKLQGYLIYPNPFTSQIIIRNYQVPTNLKSAQIYNASGQLMWSKLYNGNAYTEMPVDLSSFARGFYILKLIYTDKTVVQKIVKQ